jgi:hypothetical protein
MSAEDHTYDEACADIYDQWFGSCEEAAIDRLAELARSGSTLSRSATPGPRSST